MRAAQLSAGQLDIGANRSAANYSPAEMARRLMWSLCRPLFRFSPRPFFGWRRLVLRAFGARIGRHVNIYASASICMPWNLEVSDWSAIGEHALIYNLGRVSIGNRVTVSQGAHICAGTHDHTLASMPLLKPPVRIHDDAWICADAFVGPGVTVHTGAVVGARAVVTRDVGSWEIVVGNPARTINRRVLRTQPGVVARP